jgi:hypothetical protein
LQLEDARYLLLIRASPQQAEQLEAEARAAKIAAIQEASGFAAVFDAMRRSHKPAVGHNCMFDVAYGLYSFADSYLPSSWWDYKKMVSGAASLCNKARVQHCLAVCPAWHQALHHLVPSSSS